MQSAVATGAGILLIAMALHAQNGPPDLSGRWRLVEPTTAERALDTLAVTEPDELLITQTTFAITVEHPSKPGTHPQARTFEYESGGFVQDLGGDRARRGTWGVSHIGMQLMISQSTTHPSELTAVHGSMWRLDGGDRLVIEFAEERAGERRKVATRTYVRIKSR
jgi:hypothetical protein